MKRGSEYRWLGLIVVVAFVFAWRRNHFYEIEVSIERHEHPIGDPEDENYQQAEEEEMEKSIELGAQVEINGRSYDPEKISYIEALVQDIPTFEKIEEKYKLSKNEQGKFFVYQPSGGWGNQRIIIKMGIVAANAMGRTLILPMIAPHNFLWYGYERFRADEMTTVGEILDLPLLEKAVKHGIKVHNGTLTELRRKILPKRKWKVYTKPRYKNEKNKIRLYYSFHRIRQEWGKKTSDVIFWNKGSMWMCCGPSNQYSRNIGFHHHFRALAWKLTRPLGIYNAVHVRRGQGHTRKDRRTAELYYLAHMHHRFNKTMPLYVATDERDRSWFRDWTEKFHFQRLVFWEDLDQALIERELNAFPKAMEGDITGFIEQLICARAKHWQGSDGSTFSTAIATMRLYPELRQILKPDTIRN